MFGNNLEEIQYASPYVVVGTNPDGELVANLQDDDPTNIRWDLIERALDLCHLQVKDRENGLLKDKDGNYYYILTKE